MLPRLLLVAAVAACGAGMRTRETVQRTVMVRTTGSDLQPAATGFIYKKKNDGEESVVEMGESEVMEHLSKLYERPGDAGEERVIPVSENQDEDADGIADVDYKKMFDDSANYRKGGAYDDYLKDLKKFRGGFYGKYDRDGAEDGAEDGAGYKDNHHYGKGNRGAYHNAKYESYSVSGGHGKEHDTDKAHKQHHEPQQDGRGHHKVYDNSNNQNDHEHLGKGDKAFTGGHKYYGGGHKHADSYETKHHDGKLGHGEASAEEQQAGPSSEEGRDSSQEGQGDGAEYGYRIQH